MRKASYTPGPWKVHIGLDYFTVYNESGSTVVPESRCNPDNERDVADAYLIAAAPEMYEALHMLVNGDDTPNATGSRALAWEKADDALAKARGEEE